MAVNLLAATWDDESLDGVCLLVMMSLADWANGAGFVDTVRTGDIARRARCSERTVQRHISSLEKRGYVEKIPAQGNLHRYIVYPNGHPGSLERLDKITAPDRPQNDGADGNPPVNNRSSENYSPGQNVRVDRDEPRQRDGAGEAYPDNLSGSKTPVLPSLGGISSGNEADETGLTVYMSSNSKEKSKKDRIRSKTKFGPDDWQTQYAVAFWKHFVDADLLDPAIRDGSIGKRDRVIQKWASELNKIVTEDKYTPQDILDVAKWLFTPDNWWIKKRNIRTVLKLRRTNNAEERYFNILFNQMKGSTALPDIDLSDVITDKQMKAACKAKGFTEDDFWRRGYDNKREPLWQLKDTVALNA